MEMLVKNSIPATPLFSNLYEYLLVVHPNEHVHQQVLEEKKSFFNAYKEKSTFKTNSHIIVSKFWAKETMEETMIRWMQRIIGTQQSFSVSLNNYGGFPPHTVYLRVQDHQPFQQLANSLRVVDQYVQSNDCPPMQLVRNPHVSVAKKLPENVYEKAILDYAPKSFHASFEVTQLVLLRRKQQLDTCKQIGLFRLGSINDYSYN